MPVTELTEADLTDGKADVLSLLVKAGLCPSRGDARRNVQQGGVTANDAKITDANHAFSADELREGVLLRRGKKNYARIVLK